MTSGTVHRIAVIAGFGLALAAFAPPPKAVTVTTVVADADASISPSLEVQSDGLGSYVNSKTLTSTIQAIGDWELDARTPKNATRRLFLDFSQPIPGSGPGGVEPIVMPSGDYKFRALAQCSAYDNSLLLQAPGTTRSCPLRIGFDYNGTRYALLMDSVTAINGPFPETDFANVTCTQPTSGTGACTQWKFTPSQSYVAPDSTVKYRNVAKLLEFDSNGNFVGERGDFHVSFSIVISK